MDESKKESSNPVTSPFDTIRQITEDGSEYWSARDLSKWLGYNQYRNFLPVITKAQAVCEQSQQAVNRHFLTTKKIVSLGGGKSQREILDCFCTRYTLHLILLTSDIKKSEISRLLAFFALMSIERSKDHFPSMKDLDTFIPAPIAITKEQITIEQIIRAFKNLHTIRQYKVLSYAIDLYLPQYRIAVECDENGHRWYRKDTESKRQILIEKTLQCKFVRYNPDAIDFNIGDVINQIMMLIYQR